jgi:hypothetical protein
MIPASGKQGRLYPQTGIIDPGYNALSFWAERNISDHFRAAEARNIQRSFAPLRMTE